MSHKYNKKWLFYHEIKNTAVPCAWLIGLAIISDDVYVCAHAVWYTFILVDYIFVVLCVNYRKSCIYMRLIYQYSLLLLHWHRSNYRYGCSIVSGVTLKDIGNLYQIITKHNNFQTVNDDNNRCTLRLWLNGLAQTGDKPLSTVKMDQYTNVHKCHQASLCELGVVTITQLKLN